jgi:protein CpxP
MEKPQANPREEHMRMVVPAACALALIMSSALGQTMPTRPSSTATIPTLPTNPTRPNSPCFPTQFEPCSSANSPTGTSVNTPPTPNAYAHAFTADQAKLRIEANGYSNVTELQRDARGGWHGKAIKDGKAVHVTLDYNGNLSN